MKRAGIILVLLFVGLLTFVQSINERRVYYLDCSYSMIQNKLWDNVTEDLKKAIDAVDNQTTELVIIPFATDKNRHKSLNAKSANATVEGKRNLKDYIDRLKPKSTSTMTYLSDPLNDFYNNNRVADDRITYMFFMTDGKNEEKPDNFHSLLAQWGENYGSKHVYGFYVMLNDEAKAYGAKLKDNNDGNKQLWKVSSADVNINLIRLKDKCIFNVRNDKFIDIPIYGNSDGITLVPQCVSNISYDVLKSQVVNNNLRIYFKLLQDTVLLPEDFDLKLKISAQGAKELDILVSDNIIVKCHNEISKSIRPTFNCDGIVQKLGSAKFHHKFLWSKADTTTLTKTLHLNFSGDAKADQNCNAEFQWVDLDGKPIPNDELKITIDGIEAKKGQRFTVYSHTDSIKMTFQYLPKAKSGKHQGYLKLVDHNLNQDGDVMLRAGQTNNSLQWQIEFEKDMNPLACALMWIGIALIVGILIWLLLIKPIKYPTFKAFHKSVLVSQNGQIVYNKSCQFKGARLVVFADRKEKQSWFNRIFTGRIDTYVSPVFTQKIVFVPKNRGKKAFVRASVYTTTPNPIPQNGLATMKSNDGKTEITLR